MLLFDQGGKDLCRRQNEVIFKYKLATTTIIRPKLFSVVLDILHSEQPYSGGMEYHFI